jgi:hypothetical protein
MLFRFYPSIGGIPVERGAIFPSVGVRFIHGHFSFVGSSFVLWANLLVGAFLFYCGNFTLVVFFLFILVGELFCFTVKPSQVGRFSLIQ